VDTGLACHPLGLFGGEIPEGGVDTSAIVVAFDVAEQVAPRLVAGGPAMLVDEFDLQRVEEALHGGVIVAVAGAAHGWDGADRAELIDVGLRCELGGLNRSSQRP